ncbi:unnamed protein product [[Candida] boidinii]|nr:unnamed protein product [[Candida] boidinii]
MGSDGFVYTGVRKSGLIEVDARNGDIIGSYGGIPITNSKGTSNSNNNNQDGYKDNNNNNHEWFVSDDEEAEFEDQLLLELEDFNDYPESNFSVDSEDENFQNQDDNENDDDQHTRIPTIVIGKTTYELYIQSTKNNLHWNITYTTYGPNNLNSKLAFQNSESSDNLYIQPFHDNSLLALNSDSKSVKWVSSLPCVTVNIFDVYFDPSDDSYMGKNQFVLLPHFFHNNSENDESGGDDENSAAFLAKTNKSSWYVLSEKNYPSLVKSANQAKFITNDRWRTPVIFSSESILNMAISGVHDNSRIISDGQNSNSLNKHQNNINNNNNNNNNNNMLGLTPTNIFDKIIPIPVPNIDIYSDRKKLPPPNKKESLLAIDPPSSPTSDFLQSFNPFSSSSTTVSSRFVPRPLENLIVRAVENIVATFIVLSVLIFLSKAGLLPPLSTILSKIGINKRNQQAEQLMDYLLNEEDSDTLNEKFNKLKNQRKSILNDKDSDQFSSAKNSDDPEFSSKKKKHVKINETTEILKNEKLENGIINGGDIDNNNNNNEDEDNDDVDAVTSSANTSVAADDDEIDENINGKQELKPKKRKRGSRGGKKNKKKDYNNANDEDIDESVDTGGSGSNTTTAASTNVVSPSSVTDSALTGSGSSSTSISPASPVSSVAPSSTADGENSTSSELESKKTTNLPDVVSSTSVTPTGNLSLTDEILGYGSHGTVVFKVIGFYSLL